MSELTERLRGMAGIETSALYSQRKYLNEAADALEAQEARIRTLETALLPFAELAYAEPDNAAEWWTSEADNFRDAGKALTPSLPK